MIFPRDGLRVYDLASLWREHRGWVSSSLCGWRAKQLRRKCWRLISRARATRESGGLMRLWPIIMRRSDSVEELREYLLENISFELNAEMRAGLNLFYTLAHKHGIISDARPLKMLGTRGR